MTDLISLAGGQGATASLTLPNGDLAPVGTYATVGNRLIRFVGTAARAVPIPPYLPPANPWVMFSYLSRLAVLCLDADGTTIVAADSRSGDFNMSNDLIVDPRFPTALAAHLVDPYTANAINGGIFPTPAPYPLDPFATPGPLAFSVKMPPLCHRIVVAASGWNATLQLDACGDLADPQP